MPGYGLILLGIICLLVAWLAGLGILWTIGIIAIVIGLILIVLAYLGHGIGAGRQPPP